MAAPWSDDVEIRLDEVAIVHEWVDRTGQLWRIGTAAFTALSGCIRGHRDKVAILVEADL